MKVPNVCLCLLFAALLVVVHGAKPTGGRRRRRRVSPTPAPRVSPTPAPFVAKPTGTLPTQDIQLVSAILITFPMMKMLLRLSK